MFHLLTAHGTLVFVDASGNLLHGPVASAPPNLLAERHDGRVVLVHHDAGGRRQEVALGPQRCGVATPPQAPRRLSERSQTASRLHLEADGRFLCAEADGRMAFNRTVALEFETFLMLTPTQLEDLRTLVGERWVSSSSRRIPGAGECQCLPQFTVRLGTTDHAVESVLPWLRAPGEAPLAERGRIALRSNGWQLDWLHLFRPLAYTVVVGPEQLFDCVRLTIGSLYARGNWPGDVLLITDAAHAGFAATLPPELAGRVHVVVAPALDDAMDAAFARYRVGDFAIAHRYQPMLFLDNGIACDQPLDALLVGLAVSDRLHVAPAGPLLDQSDTFGRTLFLRDGYPDAGEAVGFSTGIIGFGSVRDIARQFAAIVGCGYGFAEQEQNRAFFAQPDQAIANYVMQKFGAFDMTLVYNATSQPGSPGGAIVHKGFLRFGGDAGQRLAGMKQYLQLG